MYCIKLKRSFLTSSHFHPNILNECLFLHQVQHTSQGGTLKGVTWSDLQSDILLGFNHTHIRVFKLANVTHSDHKGLVFLVCMNVYLTIRG